MKSAYIISEKGGGDNDIDRCFFCRDQDETFTRAEMRYIENDTLALVECIDALCISLGKQIQYIPYTATGIVREELRQIGKKHDAHKEFLRTALSYDQNESSSQCFTGDSVILTAL